LADRLGKDGEPSLAQTRGRIFEREGEEFRSDPQRDLRRLGQIEIALILCGLIAIAPSVVRNSTPSACPENTLPFAVFNSIIRLFSLRNIGGMGELSGAKLSG